MAHPSKLSVHLSSLMPFAVFLSEALPPSAALLTEPDTTFAESLALSISIETSLIILALVEEQEAIKKNMSGVPFEAKLFINASESCRYVVAQPITKASSATVSVCKRCKIIIAGKKVQKDCQYKEGEAFYDAYIARQHCFTSTINY